VEWKELPPTPEDVWLAQEDMWVQRGLLQIVRKTNDDLAELKPIKVVSNDNKTFANADWQLDLVVGKSGGKSVLKYKLRNNSQRRQSLGVKFQVNFANSQVYDLEVTGEPLPPGSTFPPDKPVAEVALPVEKQNATGLASVKQYFDWRTVPVKRIELIALGYAASRTSSNELKPAEFSKPKESATDTSTSIQNPRGLGDDTLMGRRIGTTSQADQSKTKNGLLRNRYIEISEQVRRMPFGMLLVVDQGHIQDVLTAVANSPLRIQTTEFHWRRFHGDIKPRDTDSSGGTSGGPTDGSPPPARPLGRERGFLRPGGGIQLPLGSETGQSAGQEEQEWNLVELAIYGIASLYERPPEPKPAEGTTPAQTAPTPKTASR
jgi:hypothetical protein